MVREGHRGDDFVTRVCVYDCLCVCVCACVCGDSSVESLKAGEACTHMLVNVARPRLSDLFSHSCLHSYRRKNKDPRNTHRQTCTAPCVSGSGDSGRLPVVRIFVISVCVCVCVCVCVDDSELGLGL